MILTVDDVGATAHSAQRPAAVPTGRYVALGDSYASGFGVLPYAKGTDVVGGNRCKRSEGAYAHKVGKRIDRALDFHACAEARTKDFYQANTAWGEPAQLDRVGSSTGLVTFSIGGNDAGFRKTLTDCIGGARIFPFVTCSGDKKITDPVDAALDALRGKSTQEGIHSYDAIMADIRSRAPKAAVVAVGYPHMFPVKGGEGGLIPGRCEGVKKVDQRWIAAKTDEVNAALKASALRHGYLFADPTGAFNGHELCGAKGSWFYGLFEDGRFHPIADGHTATADAVMNALKDGGGQQGAALPAAEEQVRNARPKGAMTVARNGSRLSLDASASTDADGTVAKVDWYIQRPDGSEEELHGVRTATTVSADQAVSVTAVVKDNRGMEDFVTQVSPAAKGQANGAK